MSVAMGYDPGVTGGISVVDDHGIVLMEPLKRGMTERDVLAVVRLGIHRLRIADGNVCYVEKVGYIRGDGGKGSFTFGGIYKLVRGMLLMADVELKSVTPMIWQSRMECLTGGNKNVSKARAKVLFPGEKFTHATADATLIAKYGQIRQKLLESETDRLFGL